MNSDYEGTPSYGAEQAELSPIDQIKGYGPMKRLKLKSEWLVQPLQVLNSLKESTTEIAKAFDTLLKSDEDVKRVFKEQVHLLEIMGYNEQPGDLSDLPDDEQMEDLDINLILQDDEETMKKLHEQTSLLNMKEHNEYLTTMYNEDLPITKTKRKQGLKFGGSWPSASVGQC